MARAAVPQALLVLLLLAPLPPAAMAAEAKETGNLPKPLVGASAVYLDGFSYVLGGRYADGTYSDAIYRYDHATGAVTQLPTRLPLVPGSENGGRQSGAAVASGSRIYYFGGAAIVQADVNGDGTKESVPRAIPDIVEFNPSTGNIRTLLDALPYGAWGISAAVAEGRVYLFGGFTFDISRPDEIARRDWILRFNPAETEGSRLTTLGAKLPTPMQDAAAATVGTHVYLFGGLAHNHPETNTCPMSRVYNAETEQFEEKPMEVCVSDAILDFDAYTQLFKGVAARLPYRAQFLSAAKAGDSVYLPGGRLSDGSASASILQFTPRATTKVSLLTPPLPNGTFGSPVTSDGTILTVFGGRMGGMSELTSTITRLDTRPTLPWAPRNLVATPGTDGVRLEWEPPAYDGGAPILGYRVHRATPGENETALGEVSGLSYLDATARPAVDYVYRVEAINGVGVSPTSARRSLSTEPTPPSAVRDLVAYPGNGEVLLRWRAPADNGGANLSGFRIHRDGNHVRTLPPTVFEYTDTGLNNSQTYTYTVRAYNVKGNGPAGTPMAVTPLPVPPPPVVERTEIQGDAVRLLWLAADAPVDTFVVYRGTDPGNLQPIQNVSASTREFVDTAVVRGRTYYYAVAALNEVGSSPPSSVERVSLVTIPGAPEGVFAAPLEGAIRITWRAPADTGQAPPSDLRYYVSRAEPGKEFRILATDLTATSYTDTRVEAGKTYRYTVTTLNPLASNASGEATAQPKAVVNARPVAVVAAIPAVAKPGEAVALDASRSTDEDGLIQSYRFDFGDGTDPLTATEPTVAHTYEKNGTYTVTLVVVDNRNEESAPVTATILIGEPEQKIENGFNPQVDPVNSNGTPDDPGPGSTTPKVPGPGLPALLLALLVAGPMLGRRR